VVVNITLTNIYSSEILQTLLIILTTIQTIKHISEMYQIEPSGGMCRNQGNTVSYLYDRGA
jgi:hypothetical protein